MSAIISVLYFLGSMAQSNFPPQRARSASPHQVNTNTILNLGSYSRKEVGETSSGTHRDVLTVIKPNFRGNLSKTAQLRHQSGLPKEERRHPFPTTVLMES